MCAALLGACGLSASSSEDRIAGLQLVDTIIVRETDSVYIARPVTIAASDRWGFFVPDIATYAVHHISRAGDIRDQIGRYGSGPGEFLAPSNLAILQDSILLVSDAHRLGVFERNLKTGIQSSLLALGSTSMTHLTTIGDTVIAGSWFRERNALFAKWKSGNDSVVYFGTIPPDMRNSPSIQFQSQVRVTGWADTLFYHAGFSKHLHLATTDGRLIDSIPIPRERRRGVPAGIDWSVPDLQSKASVVALVHRLSDGRLAVIHADYTVVGRNVSSDRYITIISREQWSACADLPLPNDKVSQLRHVFLGDTLVTLDQVMENDKVSSVIRRYVFPPGGCEAQPLL